MKPLKMVLAAVGIVAVSSPALAQLTKEEQARLDDILANPAKLEKARQLLGLGPKQAAVKPRTKQQVAPAAEPDVVVTAPVVVPPPQPVTLLNKNTPAVREFLGEQAARSAARSIRPREFSPCAGLNLLLRQDWKDIGLLNCPETTDKAKGAELSYANDRIADNQIWTARGTAAIYYNSMLDTSGFYYRSFGVYATVNRVINTAAAQVKGDSDKLAFGGMFETGLQTDSVQHFFRIRGGVVEDRLKDTSSANVTGEWIPVYTDGNIHIHYPFPVLNNALILRFDPALLVQYNAVTGSNQVLDFNGRPQAFRTGPQLTLRVFPGPIANGFFSRLSADATYHWAYEAYSGKGISWFQSSVTYNLDDAGQFGITGSYKKGHDEDTGTLTDIYKIALTGKI